jgi:hypothetical protein
MSLVEKVLRILNHNGASRRYSKSDAIQITQIMEIIAESQVRIKLEHKKKNNK